MADWTPLCVAAVFLLSCWHVTHSKCPWEDNLLNWNDTRAWASGKVPKDQDEATIVTGKRVLLNTQPANLSTLTIQKGAALIWGDVDDLVLNTHYVLIHGEFHIGSEECRFKKRAKIRLYGRTDDKFMIPAEEFARKFIGVLPGGTLELHGAKKTSWTKLAQTAKTPRDLQYAVIYNHTKSGLAKDKQNGLHFIAWDRTNATVVDYNVFKTYSKMSSFFDTLPKGVVIAMYAYGDDGVGSRSKGKQNIADAEKVLLELGAKDIAKVEKGDSYAFIGILGNKSSIKECTKKNGQAISDYSGYTYLKLHDKDSKLVFEVSTNPKEEEYFRVIHEDAALPVLTLVDKVEGWHIDDEVLITSTDFNWQQAEKKQIVECGKGCNARNIRLDSPFSYMHYGNFTNYVDERAEVGILTRNIKIEGVMDDHCYSNDERDKYLCKKFNMDTFGGHVRVAAGAAAAHIRGVELENVGQQKDLGHYPLHFHMLDHVKGMYMKENSVHNSFSRCLVIHGTNYLEVRDNVCYKHLGHGLFIEDAVEQNNTIAGNLLVGTQHGTLLLSDMKKEWCRTEYKEWESNCGDLSTFWLTHPTNFITDNVAAGGDGNGFMYVFADLPLGPSRKFYNETKRGHHPKEKPLHFHRNVAHSNSKSGVFVDSKISTETGIEGKGKVPENGIIQTENEYDPHVNGKPVWTNMTFITAYKNGEDNMWIKGGNIRVAYSTLADAPEGFSGGTTLFDSGTEVYKSIFIGETGNKGLGQRNFIPPEMTYGNKKASVYIPQSFPGLPTVSLTGVGLYQGPVIIKDCFFDKYVTKSWCLNDTVLCDHKTTITRLSGAISFKRSNNYPSMTSSYVQQNTFGFCDNDKGRHWVFQGGPDSLHWQWKDGNKMIFFTDKDGLLTGTVNASVVPDMKLYEGDECLKRPDWGNLMVCPYRYVKLELLGSGSLTGGVSKNYPLIIQRDDKFKEPFSIMGEIRNEFLLRTHQSYLIDYNDTHKNAQYPNELKLFGYGVESQDVVRVGICQPKDVERFEIRSDYPEVIRNNATWVSSLHELDTSTTGTTAFFHDKKNRILFFKMWSRHQDTNETQQCPDGKCWHLKIKVIGGNTKDVESCLKAKYLAYVDTTKKPNKPKLQKCPGISKPEDQGAVDWNKVGFVMHNEYSIPRKTKPTPIGKIDMGCFLERRNKKSNQGKLVTQEMVELFNSMTVQVCVNRCYFRGYNVAILSRGRRCTCGNKSDVNWDLKEDTEDKCKELCPGNGYEKCGSNSHMSMYEIVMQ